MLKISMTLLIPKSITNSVAKMAEHFTKMAEHYNAIKMLRNTE